MSRRPVVTKDAVVRETPARLATSIKVTRGAGGTVTAGSLSGKVFEQVAHRPFDASGTDHRTRSSREKP
jgi:hypothetical protein